MENIFKRIVFLLLFVFGVYSYLNHRFTRWERIIIESPDKTNYITIITKDSVRYIMNGKHRNVPESNYAKLDISNISPIGDEIDICWHINGYDWKLVNPYARFIESDLDSTLYYLQKKLDEDVNGIPTRKEYLYENCVNIDIRENSVYPTEGASLKYFWMFFTY
ncbi:hypothetical protein EYV94_22785 [Puteibacter caeruleilacunae]|nr:hypothetical protein EYV94_22785 [Puteibacter caeruleilacunae]